MLVFDIETNGLLPDVNKIHCVASEDTVTGEKRVSNRNKMSDMLDHLTMIQDAPEISGHNIIGYDIPVIQKMYPWFKPKGVIRDTLTMSSVIYPNMMDADYAMSAKRTWIAPFLFGRHSLESWGARLGCPKDDYKARCKEKGIDPWAEWNQDMEDYCVQDVTTNVTLYKKLAAKKYSEECLELEHHTQTIIARQERHGFLFDVEAAGKLYGKLKLREQELFSVLEKQYPSWEIKLPDFIPKRNNKTKGYVAGVPVPRSKTVVFNPSSNDHVAYVLQRDYKWKPQEYTKSGKVKVDAEILGALKYKGIEELVEYATIAKRISQIATGNQAWLKKYRVSNSRMHGSVKTNGAVTGRMTHSHPNMAQVPASYSPYGTECRALFGVPKGKKLVGCDADGLELRCLAHYMALFDGGKYAETVVKGRKEDGTDAHSVNQKAVGLNTRDNAKTYFYALIYGAGDEKLGSIVYEDMNKKTRPKASKALFMKLGKASKVNLEENLPALAKLTKAVKKKAKATGHLVALDGRLLPVRNQHAALNVLLQGCGAIIMKKALCLLDDHAREVGHDYEFTANVHDEFQAEVLEEQAKSFGDFACLSIEEAGLYYNFRCPLAGSSAIGDNWSQTH